MSVIIPTGQGGGAERIARPFDMAWGPMLKTQFEYTFHPGASGQIGYELFVKRRPRDGHNLLFGNMGAEMLMYALQKPDYNFPRDYIYFSQVEIDDSCIYVNRNSPYKTIQDVVAAAKKRMLNVAVSRLPTQTSIAALALGEATGARFNLIPYGGGNPTYIAVLNGEVDIGASPMVGVMTLIEKFKVLGVFNRKQNVYADLTDNAPTDQFGVRHRYSGPLHLARLGRAHRMGRQEPGAVRHAGADLARGARLARCSAKATARPAPPTAIWSTATARPARNSRSAPSSWRSATRSCSPPSAAKAAEPCCRSGFAALFSPAPVARWRHDRRPFRPHLCRQCSKEKLQMTNKLSMPRRAFCGGLAASAGLLATSPFSGASAQNYPGRRISVVIPTGQGGGAERLARAFDDAWGKILKTAVRIQLLPRRLGPDRLRAVRQAASQGRPQPAVREHGSRNDHVYDPEAGLQFPARLHLFLDGRHRRQHRLREPDVAVQDDRAGRRRRQEAAAQCRGEPAFRIPARSGCWRSAKRPSRATTWFPMAAATRPTSPILNGEADIGALPMTGVLTLSEKFKVLGVFNRTKNNFAELSDNAPLINKVFGTDIPDLYSARAWAVHTEWADKNPKLFELLERTSKEAHELPIFKEAYEKTGAPSNALFYGDREACTKYALGTIELTKRYESMLPRRRQGREPRRSAAQV